MECSAEGRCNDDEREKEIALLGLTPRFCIYFFAHSEANEASYYIYACFFSSPHGEC